MCLGLMSADHVEEPIGYSVIMQILIISCLVGSNPVVSISQKILTGDIMIVSCKDNLITFAD